MEMHSVKKLYSVKISKTKSKDTNNFLKIIIFVLLIIIVVILNINLRNNIFYLFNKNFLIPMVFILFVVMLIKFLPNTIDFYDQFVIINGLKKSNSLRSHKTFKTNSEINYKQIEAVYMNGNNLGILYWTSLPTSKIFKVKNKEDFENAISKWYKLVILTLKNPDVNKIIQIFKENNVRIVDSMMELENLYHQYKL